MLNFHQTMLTISERYHSGTGTKQTQDGKPKSLITHFINYLFNSLSALSDSFSSPTTSAAAAGGFFAAGVTPRLAGAEGCPAGTAAGFGDCFTEAVDAAAVVGAIGVAVTVARIAGVGAGDIATAAAGTALVAFPADVPVRPTAGLPDNREGGVAVAIEGNPRPPELNSSMTNHFSSLITISGFNSALCRRILISIFPPVFLLFVGSKSYKHRQ